MKISKIEFENFRNFKDHGEIKCSTEDGKITVIYGHNGDGKTTLHQLFQWVFYGEVHFNKTASTNLYNLQFESEQKYGDTFKVLGRIDFEHNEESYSLARTITYKKGLNDSEKIAEDFTLHKMDDDYNWRPLPNPGEIVEKLLPSGLSNYFFFNGEGMITDLKVKSKDSATKLREAFFSMFDLDIIESAINHIGRIDLKTTVLGKLYLSKGTVTGSSEITTCKANIEQAQTRLAQCNDKLEQIKVDKNKKQELIESISETIGENKSKAEYEAQRKLYQQQRDIFLKNTETSQSEFGEAVIEMFPHLLISKAVSDAKAKIHLKIDENKLPEGVNKKLITYLLSGKTTTCICGNELCSNEIKHIQEYLSMLPPHSYTVLYNDFSKTAKNWGKGYDSAKIESYIKSVLDNNEQAALCDKKIKELDDQEKQSKSIEDLIVAREEAENDIVSLDSDMNHLYSEQRKLEIYLKKEMERFDDLTKAIKENTVVQRKIDIMTQVVKHFSDKIEKASDEYSKKLQENIQDLVDKMLTAKRSVLVSPEFAVTIKDSHNDEGKSDGQLAVVSFAYIGGIFKLLRSEKSFVNKEYPLVLDAPFSPLDEIQRQNVINNISDFAPQVILFSKDSLQDNFDTNQCGRVWTICSNDEKNVAHIEEGYLWK